MSNSSIISLLFERYSRDGVELRNLFNYCLTSPSDSANELRRSALSIQSRWSPFEPRAGTKSRVMGVETLAEDISSYLDRSWRSIGVYLNSIQRSLLVITAEFPGEVDDEAKAFTASQSLDATVKSAGDAITSVLILIASTYNDVKPRSDDRDLHSSLRMTDETFNDVAIFLDPESRADNSLGFQLAESGSPSLEVSAFRPYEVASGANSIAATFVSSRDAALTFNGTLAVSSGPVIFRAAPGQVCAIVKVTLPATVTNSAATGAPVITFVGAGLSSVAIESYVDLNQLRKYTATLTTSVAGGDIALAVNSYATGGVLRGGHVAIMTIERISGAPSVGVQTNFRVADVMLNGSVEAIHAVFSHPRVAPVISLVSRRDAASRRKGQALTTLSNILRAIWRRDALIAGGGNVVGAMDAITATLPYTTAFWAGDPLNMAAAFPVGVTWQTPWVQEASQHMYAAFFEYIKTIINSGSVDSALIEAVGRN